MCRYAPPWSPKRQSLRACSRARGVADQNGAFWATPLPYLATTMIGTGHIGFARALLAEAVDDFKAHGIYEDIDYGTPAMSHGVLNYTASATNALWAAKLLERGDAGVWGSAPAPPRTSVKFAYL